MLFTTVLNKRIEKLCKDNNNILNVQFGFRKRRSVLDPNFILYSLVQKYFNENRRLYAINVDMMIHWLLLYGDAGCFISFKRRQPNKSGHSCSKTAEILYGYHGRFGEGAQTLRIKMQYWSFWPLLLLFDTGFHKCACII